MNDVFIGKGKIFGNGVFASRNFSKGEVVINYNLKALTKKEFNALAQSEKDFVHVHHRKHFLYSSPERFVNNSARPNTIQDIENGCDVAIRDIRKGEAITTDATKDNVD